MSAHPAARLLLGGLLAALVGPQRAEGKLEAGTVRLGGQSEEDRWGYLGKFGYAIGTGTYDVRFRLRPGGAAARPANGRRARVELEVFLDDDWDRALTLPACSRAAKGPAKRTHRRVDLGDRPEEWGPWVSGMVAQKVRPHIWYFAASSCGASGPVDVDFEVRLRQLDGSELGVELRWMPSVSAAVFACLTAFLVCFGRGCRLAAVGGAGALHPVIRALAAAVALQWAALLLEVLHLWAYRGNGTGAPAADALAGALDMLSQVVTVTLLIAIARGYSLTCARACELSGLRLVASAVAALHVALVLLDKWGGDASHKHHENGGAPGLVLLAARLLLFAWFTREAGELQVGAGLKLQAFLWRFRAAGSAYLLAYPGLLLAVQAFAPYLRHPLLRVGLLAAQTSSAFWLAGLFLTRGSYYEVSCLSSTLLPSRAGHEAAPSAQAACSSGPALRRRGSRGC